MRAHGNDSPNLRLPPDHASSPLSDDAIAAILEREKEIKELAQQV
jgi:hypothetical protein